MFGNKAKEAAKGKEFVSRAFKFRIWPNEQQADYIFKTIRAARFIYNKALAERNAYYDKNKDDKEALKKFKYTSYSYYKTLPEYQFLKEVDSNALSRAMIQLDIAFKRFFNKKLNAEYPKFKKYHEYGSYTTCNSTNSKPSIRFNDEGKLLLPKIRDGLDIHVFKPIEGTITLATIEKYPSGKYYVVLLCRIERDIVHPIKLDMTKALAISQGIKNFCLFDHEVDFRAEEEKTDDNQKNITNNMEFKKGTVVKYPEFYINGEVEIQAEQHRLNAKKRSSNNYQKQRIKLAKAHERFANQRKNFANSLSRKIADTADVVFMEKLVIPPVVTANPDSEENKKVYDNGFGMFKTLLKYKMEERGKKYIEVTFDNDINGGTISRAIEVKQKGLEILANQ